MESLKRVVNSLHDEARDLWLPANITEYDSRGDALTFLRDHVGPSIPCVWRGAATEWPAVATWEKDEFKVLRTRVGSHVIDVATTPDGRADAIVELADGQLVFTEPFLHQRKLSAVLDDLRPDDRAASDHDSKIGVPYYSAQNSNLTRDMPELWCDIDETSVTFAKTALNAEPAAVNIWLGDGRSLSTTHSDPFENLYVVVTGHKTFFLRPPCDAAVLPKPTLKKACWVPEGSFTNTFAGHGSNVPARKESDLLEPKQEFPGWHLVPQTGHTAWINEEDPRMCLHDSLIVDVFPGDMLYLPALWCTSLPEHIFTRILSLFSIIFCCLDSFNNFLKDKLTKAKLRTCAFLIPYFPFNFQTILPAPSRSSRLTARYHGCNQLVV